MFQCRCCFRDGLGRSSRGYRTLKTLSHGPMLTKQCWTSCGKATCSLLTPANTSLPKQTLQTLSSQTRQHRLWREGGNSFSQWFSRHCCCMCCCELVGQKQTHVVIWQQDCSIPSASCSHVVPDVLRHRPRCGKTFQPGFWRTLVLAADVLHISFDRLVAMQT